MTLKILAPQPSQEAPYVVQDYPYGFRLRTQMRHWIETTKNGQRWVSQTLNPKTGLWNKPKASTYSSILLLGLDEKEHVTSIGYGAAYSSIEEAKKFREEYGASLSEYQVKELTNIERLLEVYSHVEYSVRVKRYKNMRTGEISTTVSMFDLADVVEVNDLGGPVDAQADKNVDKDITRALNTAALNSMASATDAKSALDSFKRATR